MDLRWTDKLVAFNCILANYSISLKHISLDILHLLLLLWTSHCLIIFISGLQLLIVALQNNAVLQNPQPEKLDSEATCITADQVSLAAAEVSLCIEMRG